MRGVRLIIPVCAAMSASIALAQDEPALNYPPADQPLYLECKLHGVSDDVPFAEWPTVALHFPEGSGAAPVTIETVDPANQLDGGKFGFSIKARGHWSLIDSDGVPSSDEARNLPQIMFLPPEGPGNFSMFYIRDGEPVRSGVCIGMIGPDTAAAFAEAAADPSSLGQIQ